MRDDDPGVFGSVGGARAVIYCRVQCAQAMKHNAQPCSRAKLGPTITFDMFPKIKGFWT